MNKIMKKGKVEGSILFTVVVVMMVMVVFLMATLGLTSSANRRSYYTYFETQAQYAAQAALDAVTNSAYTDGEFYEWVQKASKAYAADSSTDKKKPQVTVNFDGSNIQFTDKVKSVTCEVELAEESLVWDELTGAVHKTPAYKITATASVGNGKNRSDYTVVNYIYENYRIDDPNKLPSVSNNASNTLYNWTRNSTPGPRERLSIDIPKAVYSFGKNSAGNNVQYFGPQYNNMGIIPTGRILYSEIDLNDAKYSFDIVNENICVGDSVFVGNVRTSVYANYVFQDYNEYAIIYGDLYPGDRQNGFSYVADFSEATKNKMRNREDNGYSNLPYVYVDGIIDSGRPGGNGNIVIGYDGQLNPGNENVNLYCGGFRIGVGNTGSLAVMGDVYMYDPQVESVWGGSATLTRLGRFAENNLSKLNGKLGMENIGGNLYCNNKSFDINGPMDIPGNLIFTNSAGTLNVNADITVGGKVICTGTLNGMDHITCNNIFTLNYSKVNGEPQTGDDFDPAKYLYDNFVDKDFYEMYLKEDVSWDDYKNEGYQQALMPYNMRLDEIFGTYYRWDLKGTNESEVWETMGKDALITESEMAGHTYQVKSFDCGSYVRNMENPEDWDPQTLYNDQANEFMQKPHDDVTIIEDYTGTWIADPTVSPNGGYWRKVVYNKVAIRYSDPVWVENIVYVPYTKSRSGGSFIPTYTPYTNEKEIATAIGDTMITDLSDFTMPATAPRYHCSKDGADTESRTINGTKYDYTKISKAAGNGKLIRADVPIGYHDPDAVGRALNNDNASQGWDDSRTLKNAYVIKESCYIDLSNSTNGASPGDPGGGNNQFFIDATGHDAKDPIRIVLSGTGNVSGIFVVNNTARYSTDYTSITKSYAENGDLPSKGSVQFFFAKGLYTNNLLQIFNSGLYPLACDVSSNYSNAKGKFTIVSNPVYPKDDKGNDNPEFANVPSNLRYSYEYVPITMVYGQAGEIYGGQNGWVLNANVSLPKSTYHPDNPTVYKPMVTYQEYYYSAPFTPKDQNGNDTTYPCFGIGTIVCDDMLIDGGEAASVVYIGDENSVGGNIDEDDGKTTSSQNSDKIGNENTEYFSNDHIGAS